MCFGSMHNVRSRSEDSECVCAVVAWHSAADRYAWGFASQPSHLRSVLAFTSAQPQAGIHPAVGPVLEKEPNHTQNQRTACKSSTSI